MYKTFTGRLLPVKYLVKYTMRKILFFAIPVILAGCASPRLIPQPASVPAPEKCISIPGKGCQPITAGNVGGTTLGNHDENTVEENRP